MASSEAPAAAERTPADGDRRADVDAIPHGQRPANGQTRAHGQRSIERLIVADDAHDVAPGQMRRTDFLAALEIDVTAAAERELAPAGRSVGDCPWIPYWFTYYQQRDVVQIARALVKFAPEAAGAGSVSAAVAAVRNRVVRSVRQSLALGRPVGAPEGMTAGAFDPTAPTPPPAGAPTADPILNESPGTASAAREKLGLGGGQPLDVATRGRMESVFGADLSHVRVHSDARGQTAAGRQGARAFAYGGDVAFAPGQHRPGTPVGDALLAHELAHTLQQDSARAPAQLAASGASAALEMDANTSAIGAVGRLWGASAGLGAATVARPALASGLRIARCGGEAPETDVDKTVGPRREVDVKPWIVEGTNRNPTDDVNYANTRVFPQANLQLDQQPSEQVSEKDARSLIGEDLEVTEGEPRTSTEEKNLLNRFGSSTVANVVYLKGFAGCSESTRAEKLSRGTNGMVIMGNDGTKTTLAHELGHLMGLPHRNDGDALMTGSGTSDRTVALNDHEIRTIRASNYAH